MNDASPLVSGLDRLSALVGSGRLPERAQTLGARLVQRLTRNVALGVYGPDPTARGQVALLLSDIDGAQVHDHKTALYDGIDIGIWVTLGFGLDEENTWDPAPDVLKDHSFLVCTSGLSDHLEDVAADEFMGMIDLQAGADAFRRMVAHQITLGQQSDQDHVAVFLAKHAGLLVDLPVVPVSAAPPPPEYSPPSPSPSSLPAKRRSVSPSPTPPPPTPGPLGLADVVTAFETALPQLTALPIQDDAATCAAILDACSALGETLSEACADHPADDPADQALQDDIFAAADSLVLMSLEQGIGPAIDAVTTVLQIRRDLQARIAA